MTVKRPEGWVAEHDGKDARARTEYGLSETDDGNTLLSYHTRVEPSGFLTNMFSPLVKPLVKRVFSKVMETFIKALEEEYTKKEFATG